MAKKIIVYCDGGVLFSSRSQDAGMWAYRIVHNHDELETVWREESGLVLPRHGRLESPDVADIATVEDVSSITGNYMEMMAAYHGLRQLPVGAVATLCTDSQVTMNRLLSGWPWNGVPESIKNAALAVVAQRVIDGILLSGHPTALDLKNGYSARSGRPVSRHNVWCDKECQRIGQLYLQSIDDPRARRSKRKAA